MPEYSSTCIAFLFVTPLVLVKMAAVTTVNAPTVIKISEAVFTLTITDIDTSKIMVNYKVITCSGDS